MVEENKILVKPKDYLEMHTSYLRIIQTNTLMNCMKLILFKRNYDIRLNAFKLRIFTNISIRIDVNVVCIHLLILLDTQKKLVSFSCNKEEDIFESQKEGFK